MHWKWWLTVPLLIAVMVSITHQAFGLWLSLGFFSLMADLLNDGLRARLMALPLPALRLRLAGGEISVFIDGLAKTSAEIEEMINLGDALADRCSADEPDPGFRG